MLSHVIYKHSLYNRWATKQCDHSSSGGGDGEDAASASAQLLVTNDTLTPYICDLVTGGSTVHCIPASVCPVDMQLGLPLYPLSQKVSHFHFYDNFGISGPSFIIFFTAKFRKDL